MRETGLTWLSSLLRGRELYAISRQHTLIHTHTCIHRKIPIFFAFVCSALCSVLHLHLGKPKLMTTIFGAFSLWWDWFFGFFFAIVVVVKSTFCQAPLSYYTKYGDTDRCVCEWIVRMNVQADLIIYSTFRCHKNQFEGFCCFWILYVTFNDEQGILSPSQDKATGDEGGGCWQF